MLKKTMTYTDYNGVERTEDFYFNITETEALEMEMGVDGGYAEMIQRIVNAKDVKTLIEIFKKFIFKAYGIKSEDGRQFIKSEEISKAFSETPAYNQLYMKLATDDKEAADFINAVMPKKKNNDTKTIAPANN